MPSSEILTNFSAGKFFNFTKSTNCILEILIFYLTSLIFIGKKSKFYYWV